MGALLALSLPAFAQPTAFRKIGEMELRLLGVSATVDPLHPVVPKNIPSAVRIVVRAGPAELSLAEALRFLGPNLEVHGDLSGPGLRETVSLPVVNPGDPSPADPFLLPLPGLTVSGNYTLANLRIEADGRPVLDVSPSSVTVEVIEQVLVTSVQTRALTLDEIREKGIVLDSDDYLGFEFTLGLKLESNPVTLTFPVVFDRQGVPVPDPLTPPAPPARQGVVTPAVYPLLLEADPVAGGPDDGGSRVPITLPNGQPVRIPAVLVIPGNVGYLKQFFSAQLFVANGAPVGSRLTVKDVTGTVRLPAGADHEPGTDDDPLALPETVRGPQPDTLPVMGIGPDGKPGTEDDAPRFEPGEQGQAEFLIRGEREGFHTLDFDIAAVLEGLVSGPVNIKGKATGAVLVRNPFFDMTFTVPSVVRRGERFKLYASVTNIGQGIANDVTVSLDAAALSGAQLVSDQTVHIDTLITGDSKTIAFELESQRTGQVVASYLKLEGPGQSGGTLRFSLGVGERGVPLSPDTLVLPAAVDAAPADVVDAAMRVLGQAWSVANAPSGTLRRGVTRTSKSVVVAKALALAEAGLRISLGQDVDGSLRALDYDFFAGTPRDPGFDQLLRDTEAGQALRQVFGGPAPTEEPMDAGGPRLVAASVIGPEVLAGAGPFGLHAILVFDRILDDGAAAIPTRYVIPNNTVRTAKAVLSRRLVILNLAQPEGPYVPTTIDATGLLDLRGRRGGGSVELQSRLEDPGAIVTGRVLGADGTPVSTANVVYTNNTDLTCQLPRQFGIASSPVDGQGRFEYRYVRRDNCGLPFEMVTQDPGTGAVRKSSGFVRAAGERVVLDIVLLGRGSVEGTVTDLQARPVSGARVVAVSGTDPQSGGQATSDGLGHYRIDGITVGPLSVKAGTGTSLGHAAGRIDRAGTTTTVNVVLDGGSVRVAGSVRKLENGVETTVPGVGVVFGIDPAPFPTPIGYVKTGADGRFQFEAMPPGVVVLSTHLDTGESATSAAFTVAAGDDVQGKDLLVVVTPPEQTGSVEGFVLLPGSENAPAAQALVSVGPLGTLTDASGFFRITGVPVRPNQSQTLTARSRDGQRSGATAFSINAAGEVAHASLTLSGLGAAVFTVVDPSGAPLAGQDVRLFSTGCLDPCGCGVRTTDASGRVTYDNMPLGTVNVQAIRDMGNGYEAVVASASVTGDGETGFGLLRFNGLGTVEGSVLDPDERAVFGADVSLVSRHFVNDGVLFCGMVNGESHRARTGTDGRFRFTGVGLGQVAVSARQDFYPTPATGSGTLTSASVALPFTLRLKNTTAGVLSGAVFLPDGVTPAGRGVQVTATGALPDVVVETNDQGQYRFAKVFPEGTYQLTLSDPVTGGRARARVYLRAGQDLVQDIRLKGRGTVRVTVVDGSDQPVPSAYVKLQETDFPGGKYEAAVEPPDQGTVPIDGVFEGPFSVEASDVLARGGRASGTLPGAGQVVDVKVRLTSTGTVTGRFFMPDQATPIPFGVVKLTASGKAIGQVTTQGTGDVGRFSFDYVPAGQVRLEAEDPLTGRTGVAVGEIEADRESLALDVYAQALGSVEGAVTSNGQPQAAANVTVVSGAYKATTLSDGTGQYLVRGVPAGRVVATASLAGGFLQGASSGNLEAEGATLPLDVALRDSGQVTGQVLAAGGQSAGPTSVVRLTVGGAGGATLTAVTQAEGRFSFDRVPAGQAQLVADAVGSIDSGQAEAVVPSGGSVDVPILLRGVGRIHGQALDSNGNATAGWVSFNATGFAVALNLGNLGIFDLPEVPAGPFTAMLRVTSGDFTLFGSTSGEVVAGADTPVTLQVQPSGTVKGIVLRPDGSGAYGAQVAVRIGNGTTVSVQAQASGDFVARGVPLGALTVTASDPLTAGLAVRRGLSLETNGQVLEVEPLVLDASPPTLTAIEPVPGSVRAALGGPLVLDLADVGGGLDLPSLVMTQPPGVAAGPFVIAGGRATTALRADVLVVGENQLVAQVKDLAGNQTTTEWRFTVTGGAVHGTVVQADGAPAASAPLRLDTLPKGSADANGAFVFTGLRPGSHTLQATDLATGLTGSLSFTLGDGEDRTLEEPLRLPAFGRITGYVTHPGGGAAAPGVTVSVLSRPGSVVTDANGFFDLGALPLGAYTLAAAAPDGDRGQTAVTLATLGVTVPANITLNGIGVVNVTLKDGAGTLVGGARVTVTSSSPLAAPLVGSTAPDGGAAVFPSVLAGTITARATHPSNGLEGVATGFLAPAGQITLVAALEPTGRIVGTVSRREGGVAAGVSVTLNQPRQQTTTTDPNGAFAFEDVPLGSWSLTATDPATDDVGQASGVLASAGTTADGSLTLNGVGTLHVLVKDAGETPVADAAVSVQSSGGRSYSARTDAQGEAALAHVLAGTITATATHPTNGTRGTATGALAAAASLTLPVTLQATGTVHGFVFAPDDLTAVGGAVVALGAAQVTTGPSGEFTFADRPLGTYTLSATLAGRLRARVSVTIATNAQTVEQNLALIGAAPVSGSVTAGGTAAANAQISLHSLTAVFGGVFTGTSDANGHYLVPDVPIGSFTVSAARGSDRASASGAVVTDGVGVSADLILLPSAVTVPISLTDGNAFQWQVGRDGTLNHSVIFKGPETGSELAIVRDAVATTFSGPACTPTCTAATEEGQREIVLPEDGVAGLDVTRKVYVATDGYFARQLDVVRNPGPDPVTIDLSVTTHLAASALLATSSGDAAYGPDDRWLTVDDADATDPYDTPSPYWNFWPLGVVTSGVGGQAPTAVSSTVATDGTRLLTETWSAVTLAPGESFGLLRFVSPQTDRARAQAAAERLVQLPPEALVGLSPEEGALVRNFAVPADLASAVAPLPPNDGVVSGRVLAGDGETSAGSRAVTFKSRSPYYGRPLTLSSNGASAAYQVQGAPSTSTLVPRTAFDLTSTADVFGVRSASASGDFALDAGGQPAPSAAVDIVYSGTGVLEVPVTRADGSFITSVSLTLNNGTANVFGSSGASGTATFVLLPPGAYTLTARLPNGPEQTAPVAVAAGQKVTESMVFADLAVIEGTLRTAGGTPLRATASIEVAGGFTRSVNSDAATGLYRLTDVPFGSYTVQAIDAFRSGAVITRPVTVGGPLLQGVDLQFPPVGRVQVTAKLGTEAGAPVVTAPVRWKSDARGPDYVFVGYTDSIGQKTIDFVAGPEFRVRVDYPQNAASIGESPLVPMAEGQTVDVTVVVPGVGTVTGTLRTRDGAAQGSHPISAFVPTSATAAASVSSDAAGAFSLTNVPVGPVLLQSACDTGYQSLLFRARAELDTTVPSHGAIVAQDALCPFGSITSGQRRDFWTFTAPAGQKVALMLAPGDFGTPLADPYLEVYGPDGTLTAANDNRNANDKAGEVDFTAPADGAYVVVARAAAQQTGTYRLGDFAGADLPTLRAFEPPHVTGVAKKDSDQAALPGQAVRILGDATVREAAVADANGVFRLGVFPLGAFTLEATDAEGVAVARAAGSATTPGVDAPQDLVVPARGTVSVVVKRGAERLGGLDVTLTSTHAGALDEDRLRTRTTDANGSVATTLPTGPLTARVTDPRNGAVYEVGDTLVDGGTLALTIDLPESLTHLFGTVTAADGTTALPGATVTLTGPFTFATTATAAGGYDFVSLPPGAYTLTAAIGGASASQGVSLNGGDRLVDVRVSVPVLQGRVTEADGLTPAPARVELCGGNPYTCVSKDTDAAGLYAFYGGFPAWPSGTYISVRVTAADDSGLTAFDFLYFGAGVVSRDFALPAAWAVHGVVRDAQGAPVAADVRLNSSGPERALETGSDGLFRFAHVQQFSAVVVRAADLRYQLPGQAAGTINGQDLRLDVTLAPGATLTGQLLDGSGAPLAAAILFESLPHTAINGSSRWTTSIATGADGRFDTVVPAGGFRAVHDPATCSASPDRRVLAVADGTLAPGANPEVTLRVGEGTSYPAVLAGALGTYGPSPLNPSRDACATAGDVTLTASVAGDPAPAAEGRLSPDGQSVMSLLSQANGLDVRQEQFVPPSGAFLRTITWLQNPGAVDVTADVEVTANFGDGENWDLRGDSDGSQFLDASDSWAHASHGDPRDAEAGAAWGSGAVSVSFQPGYRGDGVVAAGVVATFSVVVPAGQRVGLLTFAVGRAPNLGVPAQVRALGDLSDPEALLGLSEADRQQIVNFTAPATPNASTGVEGTVTRDGGASSGAAVAAVDPVEGTVLAYGVTDTAGHFALRGLPAGDVGLVAVDPSTNRPGTAAATVAEGSLTTANVAVIPASEMGTVEGAVSNVSGAVAGAHVTAASPSYAPLWKAEATTDSNGLYTLAAPAGFVRVFPNDDLSVENSGILDAGGTLTLDLLLP